MRVKLNPAFGGDEVGLDLDLEPIRDPEISPEAVLFGEGPHRFLVEVADDRVEAFVAAAGDLPVVAVGRTVGGRTVRFTARGETWLEGDVPTLKETWQAPLRAVWSEEVL